MKTNGEGKPQNKKGGQSDNDLPLAANDSEIARGRQRPLLRSLNPRTRNHGGFTAALDNVAPAEAQRPTDKQSGRIARLREEDDDPC